MSNTPTLTNVPTIQELLADPGKATQLSPDAAQALLIGLATLQPLLIQRALLGAHNGQEPDNGTLLTPAQVAERLNVPKSYVYECARQKQLESFKLGKKYIRFTVAAVKKYQAKYGG